MSVFEERNYICIEGNIGTGKTTLCKMLKQDFNCSLILEQFTDNPFLPLFYKHPERYAFPVELFFMTERYKQLQEQLSQGDLFYDFKLSDYFFQKTALFAKNNLQEDEYKLFLRFFGILDDLFPQPDLVVYLHRPVDQLHQQIIKRNRKIEQDITIDYLKNIEKAYFEFFDRKTPFPILILNIADLDFEQNPAHYKQIKHLIFHEYAPGIHEIDLAP
jgi:deoxyadenosine/deoxycytidine kinase